MQTEIQTENVQVPVPKRAYKQLSPEAKAAAALKRAQTIADKKALGVPTSKWSEEAKAKAAARRAAKKAAAASGESYPQREAAEKCKTIAKIAIAQAALDAALAHVAAADANQKLAIAIVIASALAALKRAQKHLKTLEQPKPIVVEEPKIEVEAPKPTPTPKPTIDQLLDEEVEVEVEEAEEELEQPVIEKKKRAYKPMTAEAKAAKAAKAAQTRAAKKAAAAAQA